MCRNFINLMHSHNFQQCITLPTRVTDHSSSLIDHIWTNSTKEIETYVINYPITDHFPIVGTIKMNAEHSSSSVYTYRKFNPLLSDIFISKLIDIYTNTIQYHNLNINDAFQYFNYKLISLIQEIFPIIQKSTKFKSIRSPWISRNLLKCIRKKQRLFKLFVKGKITSQSFKTYRNALTDTLRAAKYLYFVRIFDRYRKNPKKYWNMLNDPLGKKKRIGKKSL